MLIRSSAVLVVVSLAIAGAASSVAQPLTPPGADLGSPEAALRSYWALLDWREVARAGRPVDPAEAAYHRGMVEITTGRTQKFYQSIQALIEEQRQTKLERKIVSTAQESPQRAVIVANIRNVTPVPAGVKPRSSQLVQQRARGEDYRYVLALDGSQWKVLEVWSLHMGSRLLYAPFVPEYPVFVPPQ